jgi:hypothetical protein
VAQALACDALNQQSSIDIQITDETAFNEVLPDVFRLLFLLAALFRMMWSKLATEKNP